jgi:hypothetical protein
MVLNEDQVVGVGRGSRVSLLSATVRMPVSRREIEEQSRQVVENKRGRWDLGRYRPRPVYPCHEDENCENKAINLLKTKVRVRNRTKQSQFRTQLM